MVTSGDGQVTTGAVAITSTLPGLFTANADGNGPPAGYLVRIKSSGAQTTEPLAEFDPAQNRFVPRPINFFSDSPTQPDEIILVLFGTGLRQRAVPTDVAAVIGGSRAEMLYAGPQGSFVGLDQINVRLPQFRNRQLADIIVTVDGKTSNWTLIEFK